MFNKNEVSCQVYTSTNSGIFIIEALKALNPSSWLMNNKTNFDSLLIKHGGILLRNFSINSLSEFETFANQLCPNLLNYEYRSTPRKNLTKNIYTATEYPANQHIPLHNELSYSTTWPAKILFYCVTKPETGGETPLAHSRQVYQRLSSSTINHFDEKQVLYIRNYTKGIDLSWQEVFQTSDRAVVEAYCKKHAIKFTWDSSTSELTTQQRCQATLKHPITGENVWFNQAHLFHFSNIPMTIANLLLAELGENNLPRNAYFGDGSPIAESMLTEIRNAYAQESIIFSWQTNDLLILDNVLMAHGRRPFTGNRKIAVAMG